MLRRLDRASWIHRKINCSYAGGQALPYGGIQNRLRASPYTHTCHLARIATAVQVSCLNELQRSGAAPADGDAAATRPDWAHVLFSVLPPLPLPPGGREDPRVAAALRAAAAAAVARHGGLLRAAAVAVWELRLRGPLREAAWRVVVSMPTGGCVAYAVAWTNSGGCVLRGCCTWADCAVKSAGVGVNIVWKCEGSCACEWPRMSRLAEALLVRAAF